MMRWRALLTLLALCGLCASVRAQESASVEVGDVRFGAVRDPAGRTWWAGEVELQVRADGSGPGGRFAEGLGVELQWGVEAAAAEGGFRFYRAAATSAAVEAGRVVYRFYLPPAVVRRDRVESAPRFWALRLTLAGQELPDSRRSVGPGFSGPEALANFRRQLAARAPATDGVLLPWFLTPFASAADAPVPVRIEAGPTPR